MKLLPFRLAVGSMRRVWSERDDLLRLAAIPVVITFLLNAWLQKYIAGLFVGLEAGQFPDAARVDALWWPGLLASLASWFVDAVFAVNWMRFLLLGAEAAPGLGIGLGARHLRLAILSLLVQFGIGVPLILAWALIALLLPVPAVLVVAGLLLLVCHIVALLRLTPTWVGIAIDAPLPVALAWKRTTGYGVILALAVVIVSGALLLSQALLVNIAFSLGILAAAPLALLFISVVLQFFMIACVLTVMVTAYPRFVSETV